MSLKKKLGLGVASAALGLALIGGGTYAYFSDTAVQTNTFASGTLQLSVDPEVNVQLNNIKPGDWTIDNFELVNDGTLPIKYVSLNTAYSVTKNNGDTVTNALANKYADAIKVKFLKNTTGNRDYDVILETSLLELRDMTPEDLATKLNRERKYTVIPLPWGGSVTIPNGWENIEYEGIGVGESHDFQVKFEFEDSGVAQNDLQDLNLNLTWTFEAMQEDGERVYSNN